MKQAIAVLAVAGLGMLMGCVSENKQDNPQDKPAATAELKPTANSQTSGWVNFFPKGDKVLVVAEVKGLTPGSEHGFHIHEKGDCSAPDGTSAGGHFNPAGQPHGHMDSEAHHAGDMVNLKADEQGVGRLQLELSGVSLDQGETGLIGRGVIVHAQPDDYQSQPTGNAGGRIACGAIVQG